MGRATRAAKRFSKNDYSDSDAQLTQEGSTENRIPPSREEYGPLWRSEGSHRASIQKSISLGVHVAVEGNHLSRQ